MAPTPKKSKSNSSKKPKKAQSQKVEASKKPNIRTSNKQVSPRPKSPTSGKSKGQSNKSITGGAPKRAKRQDAKGSPPVKRIRESGKSQGATKLKSKSTAKTKNLVVKKKDSAPRKRKGQSPGALIVGISDYPPPIKKLPAVAADVREMGKLLASKNGAFRGSGVSVLTNQQATRNDILSALRTTLGGAAADQAVFVYFAGHGGIANNQYFFIAHDTKGSNIAATGVSLIEIKTLFDNSPSNRVFLWLDFCHSGGILARGKKGLTDDRHIIDRTLGVVQGHGKVIVAACTPSQFAYEDPKVGHGLFTDALLRGLRGGAASGGEVTANSLFDYIDKEMGCDRQRPVQCGHSTGRIVLMYDKGRATANAPLAKPLKKKVAKPKSKSSRSKGTWMMLGQHYFLVESVRRAKEGTVAVEIIPGGGEDEANLAGFRSSRPGGGSTLPFACKNEAQVVRVKDIETEIVGDRHAWTISLTSEDGGFDSGWNEMSISMDGNTYTSEDIAKLRAGLILLNDPPPRPDNAHGYDKDSRLDGYIRGSGNRCPIGESPIRSVYREHGGNSNWKHLARLQVVYMLKASGTVDHILELSFGAIRSGRLPVSFRGRRQRQSSSSPVTIEIAGTCPLG